MATSEFCQKLKTLKRKKKDLKVEVEEGDLLTLDARYIKRSWNVLYAAGVLLVHLVSAKYIQQSKAKEHNDLACNLLLNAGYNSIRREQYEAAEMIFLYGTTARLGVEAIELRAIINLAQTYKWKGDQDKCKAALAKRDWKTCSSIYRLCVAALRDDIDAFKKELLVVAGEEDLGLLELLEWPIFKEIRKNEGFATWVRDAYGEDIAGAEVGPRIKLIDTKYTGGVGLTEQINNILGEMKSIPTYAEEKLTEKRTKNGNAPTDKVN